jgi:hypothetical protein
VVNDVVSNVEMLLDRRELELRGARLKFRDPKREDSGYWVEWRLGIMGKLRGGILSSVSRTSDRDLEEGSVQKAAMMFGRLHLLILCF